MIYKFYSQLGAEWDAIRNFFASFLSTCLLQFGRIRAGLFFYGQILDSSSFDVVSRNQISRLFKDLKEKYLKTIFTSDLEFFLGESEILWLGVEKEKDSNKIF